MLGELIANGRTSDVHRYGSDGAIKILLPTTPQHWADLEASFTSAVRTLDVAAPEVREVVEVDGRAAVVFERIEGPSMWQRMMQRPSDVAALTRELAEIQRSIHSAGVPDGLPNIADRIGFKYSHARELDTDEQLAAGALLDQQPVGAALLHGDLHPGNILLSPTGPVVIDWFDAAVGHPAADVARTMLLLSDDATDLRHLPGATTTIATQMKDEYGRCVGDWFPPARLRVWCRLRAAGRLAEQTDLDTSGLLAIWRNSAP